MGKLYIILTAWNIFVLILYAADKRYARKGSWRIKESTLIASAFLLGGLGAVCSMCMFRHKTTKIKFRILLPLALALNISIVIWITKLI